MTGRAKVLDAWQLWGRGAALLVLLLLGPLCLAPTPLAIVATTWKVLLLLAAWVFAVGSFIGALLHARVPAVTMVERLFRSWIARFSDRPEELWLQWAREAHHPPQARWCLERAVALGVREAQFQEGLIFLEGGQGHGGQLVGLDRLRRAALRGHPEAAFRLAEALRTGHGHVLAEPAEAETWYQRAAALGYGPAAAWLARAYDIGDGVALDAAKAREWALTAERLQPFPPLSRSILRHDAAPVDPLVHAAGKAMAGVEELADRTLAHRPVRWLLLTGAVLLAVLWLGVVLTFFWAGSSQLHHLPLIFMTPPLLLIAWQAWQHYQERPRTGRDRLRESAEAGDPEACYQLGLAHRQGSYHRHRDDLTAALWFRKAAEAGHTGAMAALAEAYLGGHGVLRDPREARRWAEAGRRESTSQSGQPMEP